jgi:hypothetical protein
MSTPPFNGLVTDVFRDFEIKMSQKLAAAQRLGGGVRELATVAPRDRFAASVSRRSGSPHGLIVWMMVTEI